MAFLPPGGPMEIAFSFDTTGSMSICLDQVRTQLPEIVTRLFSDIPALRIAIFAHSDYCGSTHNDYVTKYVDFTNDVKTLRDFVQDVKSTCGCDLDECYELVLRQARTDLNWTPGSQRALVMIGDANPHGPSYPQNKLHIDWKTEAKCLNDMGVRIYGVQCHNNKSVEPFYKHLASATGGTYLKMSALSTIVDTFMAICYREHDPEFLRAYEKEVRARHMHGGMTDDLGDVFASLRDDGDLVSSSGDEDSSASMATTPPAGGAVKKAAASYRKRAAGDISVGSARKKRRSSTGSASSTSTSSSGGRRSSKVKVGMLTRSRRHHMTLRDRPNRTADHMIKKKAKRLSLAKASTPVRIIKRENAGRFIVDGLKWSPWKQALATKAPAGEKDNWAERRGLRNGVRNVHLFHHDTRRPAIYEVGVKTPQGGVVRPVLFKATNGFNHVNLETFMFRQPWLQTQADRVLQRGCKLHVRRALWTKPVTRSDNSEQVNTLSELKRLMAQSYDYAWNPRYVKEEARYRHRQVSKDGVLISDSF